MFFLLCQILMCCMLKTVFTFLPKRDLHRPKIFLWLQLCLGHMRRYLASKPPYSALRTKCILLQYKNIYNIVIIKSNSKYMIGKMMCENIWNTRSSEESKVSSCYNYLFPVTGQCFWKLSKEVHTLSGRNKLLTLQ